MGLFSKKRQGEEREAQVKQEPLYVPPVDISYCSCGCETMYCLNCFRVYCPHCDMSHVLDLPSFGLVWDCDYV